MAERSNSFVLGFAAAVCVSCSLFVSGAATLLKSRQDRNVRIDIQRNILAALDLVDPATATSDEIESVFQKRIQTIWVDRDGQRLNETPSGSVDCDALHAQGSTEPLPVYEATDGDSVGGYAIPICGMGLWSTLYGYFALEPDGSTAKGITFYKHGETPGLGGEVEKAWFQDNFKGKRIVDPEGKLVSITVIKGSVENVVPEGERYSKVDGISGATITSRGVTTFLREALRNYDPFFSTLRGGTG